MKRLQSSLVVAVFLSGCVSSTERTLREWEGVYRFTSATYNEEACDGQGPEIDLQHRFFELDTVEGVDAHLVELRPCESAADCGSPGFLTWLAPQATKARLDGTNDEVYYTVAGEQGGICQAVHEVVQARREGGRLTVTVESAIASDVIAPTEDVCFDLLTAVAEDPDGCDTLQVFEGRRVD